MLFDESLYQYSQPQPSWWEASLPGGLQVPSSPLETEEKCDVAIIGGGYTGLSAAYHLAQRDIDVTVLEAGHFGWGASGRNGGFCCIGGTMVSDGALVRKFGRAEVRRYYHAQREAVELVRSLARDEAIEIDAHGDCEMVVAEKPAHYHELERECEFRREVLAMDCRMIPREQFRDTCYDAPHQHGAIAHLPGFALNPLKFCLGA